MSILWKKIIEDCSKLKYVRNHIVDWILLESQASPTNEFRDALLYFLEELRELKSRPVEVNSWNDAWFEAHSLFVYETFLYLVAALLKTKSYQILHEVFSSHYILPSTERYRDNKFDTFYCFYGYSKTIQDALTLDSRRFYSPEAELIKRQAEREDLPFSAVTEAELLILLMAFLNPNARWYPHTLHYALNNSDFPFFIRATQHKHFLNLAAITGISEANQLREAVKAGQERLNVNQWHDFHHNDSFWSYMNMDKLDSLK